MTIYKCTDCGKGTVINDSRLTCGYCRARMEAEK